MSLQLEEQGLGVLIFIELSNYSSSFANSSLNGWEASKKLASSSVLFVFSFSNLIENNLSCNFFNANLLIILFNWFCSFLFLSRFSQSWPMKSILLLIVITIHSRKIYFLIMLQNHSIKFHLIMLFIQWICLPP